MKKRLISGLALALAPVALAPACGGNADVGTVMTGGTKSVGAGGEGGSGSVVPNGGMGATVSFGGDGPVVPQGGGNSEAGSGGWDSEGEACAAQGETAELAPVYLAFLLDESGSMGDGEHGDRAEKWDPVTTALRAFFADEDSHGLVASLSLFPLNKNTTQGNADEAIAPDCDAEDYTTPLVDPTELPNAEVFADAIDSVDPPNEYGTPTYPALAGTIQYAESLLEEDPSRKVAIVLVSDGDPQNCGSQNTTANAAAAAAEVADRIPTYAIGVGLVENLNAIAAAGGTESAFIVDLEDPEQTQDAFLEAVNAIRGQVLSCELEIPAPPEGKTLDPQKVEVEYTPKGEDPVRLPYRQKCQDDTGWHYDDPDDPTRIQLCSDTCEMVQASATALNVVFGCVDRVDEVIPE